MTEPAPAGPLAGLKVLEMAGLGPVPLAGLLLAEFGADVLRIERRQADRPFLAPSPPHDLDRHGRAVLQVDLKRPEGVALVAALASAADVILEGFRPGVMERLCLGPEPLTEANPRLVYGRMTGFGRDGPLAGRAGHDLTYLAYTGILASIGPAGGRPLPPLNLVADYGGGAMLLLAGVLAALFERFSSGRGQVVDAAMVDGASLLAAPFFAFLAAGLWQERRGANLLDSGAPFYDTYETADGRWMAVACLEPRFFAEFARLLPLDGDLAARQYDRPAWPAMRAAIAARFGEATQAEWSALFEPTDACVAPVLALSEAPRHPHSVAREAHVEAAGGLRRPAPAPRLSRTPLRLAEPAAEGCPFDALGRFGIVRAEAERLAGDGILG